MIRCKTLKRFTDLTVDKVREINEVLEVTQERFNVLQDLQLVDFVETVNETKPPKKVDENKDTPVDETTNQEDDTEDSQTDETVRESVNTESETKVEPEPTKPKSKK